jgi:putative tryptophan/tyrosine transport system substrate-binding protein
LPIYAQTQQPERTRRIGVLMTLAADDKRGQTFVSAFVERLQQLGWKDGGNAQVYIRWGGGDANRIRRYAAELVALAPDAILANGAVGLAPLLQVTRSVPIVFVIVPDPVGAGFVESLARPGGNATGFVMFEYALSGKWLELLKAIAPTIRRVAVIRDPTNTFGTGQWGAIQAVAPSFGVEVSPVSDRDPIEIERVISAFASKQDGGLIVTASALAAVHRELIIALASRHKLPAAYYERGFVAGGGLISYGPDFADQYRQAASYIDRVLKGEAPADLPVQAPSKYEVAVNLGTAKALGLAVPPTLLARADEVIE